MVNKYPQYKSFKMGVLKTAEKELKELADAGLSDCWFEYKEKIEPEKLKAMNSNGEIDADENRHKYMTLEFILHTTEMGEIESARCEDAKQNIDIDKRLAEEFDQTPSQRKEDT